MCGRKSGKEAAEVIEVSPLFELEVKVLLGEVEVGEPVLIHEFDDAADFLEVHDERGLKVRSTGGGPVGRISCGLARGTGEIASSGNG